MRKIDKSFKIKADNQFEANIVLEVLEDYASLRPDLLLQHDSMMMFIVWNNLKKFATVSYNDYRINSQPEISVVEFVSKYGTDSQRIAYLDYRVEGLEKQEFEYPLYFKSDDSLIIEFDGLESGEVIEKGNVNYSVGYYSTFWVRHTNKKFWTHLPNYKKQEYPVFIMEQGSDRVWKYTDNNSCECVMGEGAYIGGKSNDSDLKARLESGFYTKLDYNKKRNLYDGQAIWGWDDEFVAGRVIKFYDAKNGGLFRYDGIRDGFYHQNYKALTKEQLKTMPFVFEMFKKLKF